MMKKKNIALAMAAVSVAGTVAPAFAATAEENKHVLSSKDYAAFDTKLKALLGSKYSSDAADLTGGVTTGSAVYEITMTTSGETTTVNSLDVLNTVNTTIKNSKRGEVFNFTVTDKGHSVKSDGKITNIGKMKYTISDIAGLNVSDITVGDKVYVAAITAADSVTGSRTVTFTASASDKYTVKLTPGMEQLNFAAPVVENGVLKGFKAATGEMSPVVYEVAVSNSTIDAVTVTKENVTKIAEELNSKYTFSNLSTAKEEIKEVNGKFQVTLFASDIKLSSKAARTSIVPEGTLTQIVLTANTKAELEALISALNGNADFSEIVGDDRISTAIELSKTQKDKNNLVLVGYNAIVDGLAAAPLAAEKDAPVLITEKDSLPANVKEEIKRVLNLGTTVNANKGKTVYIAGGEAVISKAVEAELANMGLTVKRLAGDDRFATSLAIAKEIGLNSTNKAYVVGGYGLADAMSIAPVAAQLDSNKQAAPIVVVDGVNGLSNDAKTFLTPATSADVIGGEFVISNTVLDQVAKTTGNATRVAGNDRHETNAKVITKYFAGKNVKNVYVAKDGYGNDTQLVDALAAAPVAGSKAAPIVLATDAVTVDQAIAISSAKTTVATDKVQLVQVGGGVKTGVIAQLKNLLGIK